MFILSTPGHLLYNYQDSCTITSYFISISNIINHQFSFRTKIKLHFGYTH